MNILDFNKSLAGKYIGEYQKIWEVIPNISNIILSIIDNLDKSEYIEYSPDVWVHKTTFVDPSASITGPCLIGSNTNIRHCAFIRGAVLIGNDCVIGNSVEVKNSIIFDSAQIPHFNYIGDSIIGYKAHFGAQALTSNVKSDKTLVTIKYKDKKISTGLKKFGAIVGDSVEIGCSSVLCPGTIIGKNTTIYPLSLVRGYIENNSIIKNNNIYKKVLS